MTPLEWIMQLLDAVGSQPKGRAPRQCPAHEDAAPSLSLHDRDGVLMLFCHAGCDWRRVLRSLKCSGGTLHAPPSRVDGSMWDPAEYAATFCSHLTFPKLERGTGHPALNGYKLEAVHDYGVQLLERWRHPVTRAKDLMWWTKTDGGRVPGLLGVPVHDLPLYRENEVRAAVAMDEPVLLVESESSADALKGWTATTWAGGASSVPIATLQRVLGGYRRCVCIPDVDGSGLACAAGLRASDVAPHMLVGRVGEDAKDLYSRVGADAFANLIEEVLNGDADQRTQAG